MEMKVKKVADRIQLYKQQQQKKIKKRKGDMEDKWDRFLITVNVSGSTGPIRFVVNGDDNAGRVIEKALQLYARQGRLPILGSDINSFLLYRVNAGFDALKSSDAIGLPEARSFALYKKEIQPQKINGKREGWRKWLQKSFSLTNLRRQAVLFVRSISQKD